MLLNVKGHILVEVKVLPVTIIGEGLELGHNGTPRGCDSVATEEDSMQDTPNLTAFTCFQFLSAVPIPNIFESTRHASLPNTFVVVKAP